MNSKTLIILNYHLISTKKEEADSFSISEKDFLEQMNLLKELKIPVVSLEPELRKQTSNELMIALTFDDGYDSDHEIVIPILEKLNFPASFFPILNKIDSPGRLSSSQLRSISNKGFTIGSHGISHTLFSKQSLQEQEYEMSQSKKNLEELINRPVNFFSLPYGWYNKKIIQLAKQNGYQGLLSTGLKINTDNENRYVLYRWNISQRISTQQIQSVLCSNGKLPLPMKIGLTLKQCLKKILGTELIDRFN